MVVSLKQIWVIFITLIGSYALKIPFINTPIYRILFPVMTVLFFVVYRKQNARPSLFRNTVKTTWTCWLVIIIWGLILSIIHNSVSSGMDYLWWDVCLVCMISCYSVYFESEKLAKTCMGTFFIFSALIGLSGIYECATGRLYHETHISYRINKNIFGLVRPNTIFFNVNDSAVFMCMALIVAYLLAEYCKKRETIKLIALLIFGSNIILTESRGALLGATLFLYIYYLNTTLPRKKIIYVLAAVPVVLSVILFFQEVFFIGDINFQQLGGRGIIWRNSLSNLLQSHFLGNGPGNTVARNSLIAEVAAVHNWFLELTCDYGLLGGFSLLIWYTRLLNTSHKLYRTRSVKMSSMMIVYAGLISFIPLSICPSSLFGKVWPICFFSILIAEINRNEKVVDDILTKQY